MKSLMAYRYSRFFVAAVLVFAALTKAWQTATTPSDSMDRFAMGVVIFEMGLAFALISGVFPRWIKWLAAAVFGVFFCVAVDLALKSAASCGCFGIIHVDPRITACLDLAVVLVLIVSRCETAQRSWRQIAVFGGGVVVSLLLLIPMSLHPAVMRVEHIIDPPIEVPENGIPFILRPGQIDLGYVESQSVTRFTLELANNTDNKRAIDNVSTDCQCIAIVESPKSVAEKSKAAVICEFTAPEMAGPYSKRITVTSENEKFEAKMSARIDHPLVMEAVRSDRSLPGRGHEFAVRNEGTTPVRLLYATVTPPVGMVKIDAQPVEPGQSKVLKFQYQTGKTAEKISVRIQTNHRIQKQVFFAP